MTQTVNNSRLKQGELATSHFPDRLRTKHRREPRYSQHTLAEHKKFASSVAVFPACNEVQAKI